MENWSKKLIKVGTEREWDWYGDSQELIDFISQELDKAREEGKKEAFTKDEWFMLELAMNDIFNSGNTAYEEISKKIEGYLKGELSGEAEHIKAHKEYLATSKQDTPKEWEEDIRREYGHMYIRNEDGEFCLVSNEIDWLIDEIKQLLDKAREETYKELIRKFDMLREEDRVEKWFILGILKEYLSELKQ